MVIKNLICKWCKREEKEFTVKDGKKTRKVTTPNMLWLTFLAEEENAELTNLYDSLGIKDKQYVKEDGTVYINLSTRFDIPCVFENKKYNSFEELVANKTISTNDMCCDIAINNKGYISAINVVENGTPYASGLDEFDYEEVDEELPFN